MVYRRLTFRFYVDHWLGQVSISSGRAATGSLGERRGSRERGEGVGGPLMLLTQQEVPVTT